MGQIGPLQLLIIVGIALLLFGGSRIASIGKGLGEGIKNFKKGISDDDSPKQLAEKNEKKGSGEADDEQDEKKRG